MIRRLLIIMTAMLLLVCSIMPAAYAHDSQKEHDDDLLYVLFGEGYSLARDKKPIFQAIADAAALCIDQFSVNAESRSKEKQFNDLKQRVGFSISFNDIDLLNGKDGLIVSARTHRRYTHRGWDFPYTMEKEQQIWTQRKKILTATVNKELFGVSSGFWGNFHFLEGTVYSETACSPQCDAFCELVYYVHILGDFMEATSYSAEFQQLVPLTRPNDNSEASALVDDIIELIPELFPNQKNKYSTLVDALNNKIRPEADRILNTWGGIQTQEQFNEYHQCAKDVLQLLMEEIPGLLRNEEFFSKAFFK